MSNSLIDFCSSTSQLEHSVASQKFQNFPSLLENDTDLVYFLSFIPQFHKNVRKAAWKSCQKKFKSSNGAEMIEEAFKNQKTEELRKDFLYFISSYGDPKCLLGQETFSWLVKRTEEAIQSLEDLQDLATLTKILNSTIKVLSDSQIASVSTLIPFMKNALQKTEFHLHIELCASCAVTIVNYGIAKKFSPDEFFSFLELEKEDDAVVYKLFIVRALVSCLPETSLLKDFGSWRICDFLIATMIDIR